MIICAKIRSVRKSQASQTTSDYGWLQVTTNDYDWLQVIRAGLRVTTTEYKRPQETTSDYKWRRGRLRVTESKTKIKIPQLWVKGILTS